MKKSVRKGTNLPNEVTSLLRSLGPSPKGDLNREVPLYIVPVWENR
jgi:hypothetical protein